MELDKYYTLPVINFPTCMPSIAPVGIDSASAHSGEIGSRTPKESKTRLATPAPTTAPMKSLYVFAQAALVNPPPGTNFSSLS